MLQVHLLGWRIQDQIRWEPLDKTRPITRKSLQTKHVAQVHVRMYKELNPLSDIIFIPLLLHERRTNQVTVRHRKSAKRNSLK